MAAPRAAALAALLLLAALAPAALPGARAQAGVTLALVSLQAGYGPETWKDQPPVGQVANGVPLPVSGPAPLGVYENPYQQPDPNSPNPLPHPHQGAQTWLGYNLTATFELRQGGSPVQGAGYSIEAALRTADGDIPAVLARVAPGRFTAQFDLDGEDGRALPGMGPGDGTLHVDANFDSPQLTHERVASGDFPVHMAAASLDLAGFLLDDADLVGYADTGPGNQTLVANEVARPGENLTLVAHLGVPGAPASLVAWDQGQGFTLATGTTDGSGIFSATVDAAQLTGNRSGLAVVEAHLDGSQADLASAPVAVAVSGQPVRITSFDYQPRVVPVANQPAQPLDTLTVGVEDLNATATDSPSGGTLYVLLGGTTVGSFPFDPTSMAPGAQAHDVVIPAAQLNVGNATSYRMLAMLTTPDGRLYSLAQAVRGYDVSAQPATARPQEQGNLSVVLRNFNNNLDEQRDDGMALPVSVVVTGLPGGARFETDVRVNESSELTVLVPFRGDAGGYLAQVNTTSGELARTTSAAITIAAPPGLLPGFDAAAALAAAALAGALLHRRRASR